MYVGVILVIPSLVEQTDGIPHVCGGDPAIAAKVSSSDLVFPMYVGVILTKFYFRRNNMGIPHVCGGDPSGYAEKVMLEKYSPCMWG